VLLSIHAYVSYRRRLAPMAYAGVIVFFGLALMSKPMVVTLPVLLLLLDVWPLRRRPSLGEKWPLFVMAIATAIATVVVQRDVGAVATLSQVSIGARITNALMSLVFYLRDAIWPTHLAAFYPLQQWAPWIVAAAAAFIVRCDRRGCVVSAPRSLLLHGLGVVPRDGVAGHRIGPGGRAGARRPVHVRRAHWPGHRRRMGGHGIPADSSSCDGVGGDGCDDRVCGLERGQVQTWATSESLWRHALSVTSSNYVAHEKLAEALRDQGRFQEAREHYQAALATAPPDSPGYVAMIRNDLGLVAGAVGSTPGSADAVHEAARLNPRFCRGARQLGK